MSLIQDEIAEADGDSGLGLRRRPDRDHTDARRVGDVLCLAREHDDHHGCVVAGHGLTRRARKRAQNRVERGIGSHRSW